MNTLNEKISELNDLVRAGRALEAFEKFYHPNVAMQENENLPTVGKEANYIREKDFFSKVNGFHENAVARYVSVGDGVTMVHWSYDYHHQEWGKKKYQQISVQHWLDDLIIKEQFFYAN